MLVEGPGQALPHATKDDKVVPQSFKNTEKGQWVVFLKKGRSKRALDVDEDDEEDGDEEEEDEEEEEDASEGSIVEEEPLEEEEEEEKPKKHDKGKGRRKKTLQQEFFQEPDNGEEEGNPSRESKRRRKAPQEEDTNLTDREVVRVNVKLCLRSNVHAKKQLAAAPRLLLEVPNNLLRWHLFLRSECIPVPTNVVSTLRGQGYKYKDYASLHFFCANCINRSNRSDRPV